MKYGVWNEDCGVQKLATSRARTKRIKPGNDTHNNENNAQNRREHKGADESHDDRREEEDGGDDPDGLEHGLELFLEAAI